MESEGMDLVSTGVYGCPQVSANYRLWVRGVIGLDIGVHRAKGGKEKEGWEESSARGRGGKGCRGFSKGTGNRDERGQRQLLPRLPSALLALSSDVSELHTVLPLLLQEAGRPTCRVRPGNMDSNCGALILKRL